MNLPFSRHGEAYAARSVYETVPLATCVTYLGFSFDVAGWHPLQAAARAFVDVAEPSYDGSEMARFYAGFRPATVADAYLLDAATASYCSGLRAADAIHVYPWSSSSRRLSKGECQHFGPAPNDGPRHFSRQGRLVRSNRDRGYMARRLLSGAVKGIWLVSGSERRFLLLGGQHRAGALAALGGSVITVRVDGMVDLTDVDEWPPVRSKAMSRGEALAMAQQYFRLGGRERAPGRDDDRPAYATGRSSHGQRAPSLAS